MIINAVPFLPGYRWHRTARIWRTPVLGELAMGATNRRTLRLASQRVQRHAGADARGSGCTSVLDHFDQGTQRAILRLYRSSPPGRARGGGRAPGRAATCRRSSCGARATHTSRARFGRAYAGALPSAELLELPDAGHWPWLDRPDVIERVVGLPGAARRERARPRSADRAARGAAGAASALRASRRRGRSRRRSGSRM